MAASAKLLTRLFNEVKGSTIKVEQKHRPNADTDWSAAEVIDTQVFDVNALPDELVAGDTVISLKAYGVWKLLSERTSESTADAKLNDMRDVFDLFLAGQWRAVSASRSAQVDALFVQAIVNLKEGKFTPIQVQAMLQAMDADQRKALRNSEAVSREIARLKAEVGEVSADDLSDLIG